MKMISDADALRLVLSEHPFGIDLNEVISHFYAVPGKRLQASIFAIRELILSGEAVYQEPGIIFPTGEDFFF